MTCSSCDGMSDYLTVNDGEEWRMYDTDDLKPCPFCGSKAEVRTTYEVLKTTTKNLYSYVRCERCFAESFKFSYKNADCTGANPIKSAINAWNRRDGVPHE